MMTSKRMLWGAALVAAIAGGCGSHAATSDGGPVDGAVSSDGSAIDGAADIDGGVGGGIDAPPGQIGPAAGNPDGSCAVPAAAQAEDSSNPKTVIGHGTPESCTGDAFVAAVAQGGVITFDCGADPTTITLTATAKVFNDTGSPKVVIDGGGKITLSGGGRVRVLYQNTCDAAQRPTGPDCNNQQAPALTLQNLTIVDGNSKAIADTDNAGGGGAVWVRGGRLKIINSRFFNNVCADLGSDLGGGAVRVLDFPTGGSTTRPVYIVHSTFGGASELANHCANGGALSSIGTSYTVLNSLFSYNQAVGHGANDGQGGNGGAIYNDGNTMALSVCGTSMEDNHANEGGSAIFFVSNNGTGTISITDSTLKNNPKGTFETPGFPGLYVKAMGPPMVVNSTIQ
jgi:hypothetical protein